jgi:hypothetical protein
MTGANRFRHNLEKVRYLRLESLQHTSGEHRFGYKPGTKMVMLRKPGEDGYSPLQRIAIAKGHGKIVEAIRKRD